ncbi:hypothetical protein JCM3766R1_005669 [Sporobolomyces carnicolor]
MARSSSINRSRPLKPTPAFSQDGFSDGDENGAILDEADSEEDEWDEERAGPSSSSNRFDQGEDSESEDEDDDDDGLALYESDQGEVIDDEDEDEEEAIGKQLASIPFDSLLKAQKQLAKSNAHASRKGKGKAKQVDEEPDDEGQDAPRKGKNGKGLNNKGGKSRGGSSIEGRSNKHAPTEMSTKRPVSRARQIVETSTKKARDPRFDALSGSVNPELFQRSYSFLSGSLEKEVETLRQTAVKARKNAQLPEAEKEKIEDSLRRMENRLVERKRKEREQAALKGWKKEEKAKREQGKGAFYLKEADKKKLFLKAKFDELSQDKRKLSKAMDKKRRKTSQKEKKQMPRIRPGGSG